MKKKNVYFLVLKLTRNGSVLLFLIAKIFTLCQDSLLALIFFFVNLLQSIHICYSKILHFSLALNISVGCPVDPERLCEFLACYHIKKEKSIWSNRFVRARIFRETTTFCEQPSVHDSLCAHCFVTADGNRNYLRVSVMRR